MGLVWIKALDAADRPCQRDRPRRPRARRCSPPGRSTRRRSSPTTWRSTTPPEAYADLRPPRGAEDRAQAVTPSHQEATMSVTALPEQLSDPAREFACRDAPAADRRRAGRRPPTGARSRRSTRRPSSRSPTVAHGGRRGRRPRRRRRPPARSRTAPWPNAAGRRPRAADQPARRSDRGARRRARRARVARQRQAGEARADRRRRLDRRPAAPLRRLARADLRHDDPGPRSRTCSVTRARSRSASAARSSRGTSRC